MTDAEKILALKKAAKNVKRQLKAVYENAGNYENPVDADLAKTIKAMFYEEAITILKQNDEVIK